MRAREEEVLWTIVGEVEESGVVVMVVDVAVVPGVEIVTFFVPTMD